MLNHSVAVSDLSHSTLGCSHSLHNCSHTTSILILSSPGRLYDFQAANGEEVTNLQHTHTQQQSPSPFPTNMVLTRRVCPSASTLSRAAKIHFVLKAIRSKLGGRNDGPDVRDIHRFLTKSCRMPKEVLDHKDFVCSTAKYEAVQWGSRCALFQPPCLW